MLNTMQAQGKHSITASFVCFIGNEKQQQTEVLGIFHVSEKRDGMPFFFISVDKKLSRTIYFLLKNGL